MKSNGLRQSHTSLIDEMESIASASLTNIPLEVFSGTKEFTVFMIKTLECEMLSLCQVFICSQLVFVYSLNRSMLSPVNLCQRSSDILIKKKQIKSLEDRTK